MSFAQGSTVYKTIMGNKRVHYGSFSQASGDTGGDFATGLRRVEHFDCTWLKSASVSGGIVTATTADPGATVAGYWKAIGF